MRRVSARASRRRSDRRAPARHREPVRGGGELRQRRLGAWIGARLGGGEPRPGAGRLLTAAAARRRRQELQRVPVCDREGASEGHSLDGLRQPRRERAELQVAPAMRRRRRPAEQCGGATPRGRPRRGPRRRPRQGDAAPLRQHHPQRPAQRRPAGDALPSGLGRQLGRRDGVVVVVVGVIVGVIVVDDGGLRRGGVASRLRRGGVTGVGRRLAGAVLRAAVTAGAVESGGVHDGPRAHLVRPPAGRVGGGVRLRCGVARRRTLHLPAGERRPVCAVTRRRRQLLGRCGDGAGPRRGVRRRGDARHRCRPRLAQVAAASPARRRSRRRLH